jgi:cytochrome c oxidase subunit III
MPEGVIAVNALEMEREWKLPDRGTIGIALLIVTETVLFAMFVAVYLVYSGRSLNGPYPKDVLDLPIVASICLLSSSLTVYFAEHALQKGKLGSFKLWWTVTILLGLEFLISTGVEWRKLIFEDHLTISTNLFGTTFYSLVGLHASHVIVGLSFLSFVLVVTLRGFPIQTQARRVIFLSWYWHFVDVVWVIVFTVVYVIGR